MLCAQHIHVHVHVHVHCTLVDVHVHTVTLYLGQFIGECDEEFAISLSVVWRESENTCHIVTLWTLLFLRGREGGREGGREREREGVRESER